MEEKLMLLQVFPEEIWIIILDKCEDVGNVFKAFPQMKSFFRGKAFSWLMDDLIPLLYPKLICFKDIKNCRLVSKRWKNSVDKCLESHVDLDPYNSSSLSTRLPETHFNYRHMPKIFDSLRSERKILEVMKAPTTYNPFPGRCIEIYFDITGPKIIRNTNLEKTYEQSRSLGLIRKSPETLEGKLFSLFEKFGHHIWYITICIDVADLWCEVMDLSSFMIYLVDCLELLPNLKSLTVDATRFCDGNLPQVLRKNIIAILSQSSIPARLDTLNLSSFGEAYLESNLFQSFIKLFVNHNNIKSLTIYAGNWSKNLARLLPNLVELCLIECYSTPDGVSLKNIVKELSSFPLLQKLGLLSNMISINVTDLLQVNTMPQLQALVLDGKMLGEIAQQPCDVDDKRTLLFVRNLKIQQMRGVNFEFLRLFPSLQILYLFPHITPGWCHDHVDDAVSVFVDRILKGNELLVEHFQRIWETFPQLKMVTVQKGNVMYQLVREHPAKLFTVSRKIKKFS